MAGEDALLNLAMKLFSQSRFDSGFTLFIGRIEVLCVGDRLHWIYWHLVIPVFFCAWVVVVFLAFQVKITRICLVCPLSTSLFRAIASSALLAELDLVFHITYVLWAWESATFIRGKTVCFDDLPTAVEVTWKCSVHSGPECRPKGAVQGLQDILNGHALTFFPLPCSDVLFSRMLWFYSSPQLVTFRGKQRDE